MQTAATTTELIGSEDLEFELNDSITTFKVWVEGVSVTGGLLCATSTLLTRYTQPRTNHTRRTPPYIHHRTRRLMALA